MATVQFYWPIKVYEAFVYAEQEQNDALSITLLYALNLLKDGKLSKCNGKNLNPVNKGEICKILGLSETLFKKVDKHLVDEGYIEKQSKELFEITKKGKNQCEYFEDNSKIFDENNKKFILVYRDAVDGSFLNYSTEIDYLKELPGKKQKNKCYLKMRENLQSPRATDAIEAYTNSIIFKNRMGYADSFKKGRTANIFRTADMFRFIGKPIDKWLLCTITNDFNGTEITVDIPLKDFYYNNSFFLDILKDSMDNRKIVSPEESEDYQKLCDIIKDNVKYVKTINVGDTEKEWIIKKGWGRLLDLDENLLKKTSYMNLKSIIQPSGNERDLLTARERSIKSMLTVYINHTDIEGNKRKYNNLINNKYTTGTAVSKSNFNFGNTNKYINPLMQVSKLFPVIKESEAWRNELKNWRGNIRNKGNEYMIEILTDFRTGKGTGIKSKYYYLIIDAFFNQFAPFRNILTCSKVKEFIFQLDKISFNRNEDSHTDDNTFLMPEKLKANEKYFENLFTILLNNMPHEWFKK